MIDESKIKWLVSQYNTDDIPQNRYSLSEIIRATTDLCESLHLGKVEVKSWQFFLETLIHKIIFHSSSVQNLTEGFELSSHNLKLKVEVIDIPSIFVLTRAALEAFLTLEYIYINDLSESEKFFRFKLWEVSGLLSRQGFEYENNNELKNLQDTEMKMIVKLKAELQNHPEYANLNKHQISKINKYGLPRKSSWQELIEYSTINTTYFSNIYSLFSNYAHSEYLSIIQMTQSNYAKASDDAISNSNLSVTVLKQLNCLIIEWLAKTFKPAEILYNEFSEELKSEVIVWSSIAKR